MGLEGTDRFEVRRRLGTGCLGVVYEAFDRERFQRVALKTLPGIDTNTLFRFKSEFGALQRVEHPNLVNLLEMLETGGTWVVCMELVEGCDIISYVRGGLKPGAVSRVKGPIDEDTLPVRVEPIRPRAEGGPHRFDEQLLRLAFAQASLGLVALHSAGIVHRNLKPSNIRVTPEGRVVLLDYGLGLNATAGVRTDSRDMDAVTYMAPEQALAGSALPEVDWYALGAVFYESLTGLPPFAGKSQLDILMSKERAEPPAPHVVVPGLAPELDLLCQDLLSHDPQERPKGKEVLDRWGVDAATAAKAERSSASASHLAQAGPFVGRESELETLRSAFEDTKRGETRVVSIVGESGLGKTALMRRFLEVVVADAPTTVVLAGRCYERESAPFHALSEVVDTLARHLRRLDEHEAALLVPRNAAILPRAFPPLGRVELLAQAPQPHAEPRDPHELRSLAFSALRDLLFRLAEANPVIVIVDAMQWVDADSMILLRDLVRQPDAPSLLLLLAARPDDDADEATSRGLADLGGAPVTTIQLNPLDRRAAPELARLLIRRARLQGMDPFEIALEARGHPLYIDELVRHAATAGSKKRRRPRLEEAIWARAFGLSPVTRRVLELAALAGGPLQEETLADAAKLSAADLDRHLAELRGENLVRTRAARDGILIELYHDCVREAVLSHLESDMRAERHGRLAVALEGGGAADKRPELLLRHLEASGQNEKAAALAVRAARAASAALAFDRAAALYRTALRLGAADGDELVELRVALAEALANAGHGPESAEAFLEAAEVAEAAVRLDCERRAAEQYLVSGHIERGIAALDGLLRAHGVAFPATPRRAVASVLWRRALMRMRGLRWTERHPSEVSKRDLTRIDVYKTVSQGIGMVDTLRGADFHIRGLRLAMKTGERGRVGRLLAQEVIFVASQGQGSIPRARALHAETRRIAERSRDPYLLAWADAGEGLIAYFEGRFQKAAAACERAELKFRRETVGTWWEVSSLALFRLLSLTRQGLLTELIAACEACLRDAVHRGDRYSETTIKRACGVIWLARDRPEDGLRDLEHTPWPLPERGFHLQHWYYLQARGEIALYRGEAVPRHAEFREDFTQMERSLLTRIEIVRIHSRWLRGQLAVARAQAGKDRREALAEARRMLRKLERERIGFARVWVLLLEAGIANVRGEESNALDLLGEAAQLAETQGMMLCQAVANRRRGEILGGEDGAHAVERVDKAIRELGAADPERISNIIAPGF